MTRQEFTERTGIQVTDEQMWKIHTLYEMSEEDKDGFCRIFKTMCWTTQPSAIDFLCALGRKIAEERDVHKGHIEELQEENDDLQEFIFKQSIEPDESLVADKALELFGKDEYYARLVEDGIELDGDAREYVASKLRA